MTKQRVENPVTLAANKYIKEAKATRFSPFLGTTCAYFVKRAFGTSQIAQTRDTFGSHGRVCVSIGSTGVWLRAMVIRHDP